MTAATTANKNTTTTTAAANNKKEDEEEEETAPFPPPLVTETLQYRLVTGNIGKNGGQRGSLTRCAQKFGTFQSKVLLQKQKQGQEETEEKTGKQQQQEQNVKMEDDKTEKDPKRNDNDKSIKTKDATDKAATATTPPPKSLAEQVKESKQELFHELEWYLVEWNKLILVQQNWQQQVLVNQQAQQKRQEAIRQLQADVTNSHCEAQQSQHRQSCFLEYEALAKITNENHPQTSRSLRNQIQRVQHEIQEMEDQQQEMDKTLQIRSCQFHLFLQYLTDLKRTLNKEDENDDEAMNDAKDDDDDDNDDNTTEKPVAMEVDHGQDEDEDELYEDL